MIATVLPAYNEPRGRLLASVQSALAVSELVVVSDDGSREPIEPIDGVEIVRHENAGPAAAMNRGVEHALSMGATRIARLDVGDRFLQEAKRKQLERAEPALASWHFDLVRKRAFRPSQERLGRVYFDGVFCICTTVVSADVWREVGGFDESLRYGDDWEWAMRVHHAVGWTMHTDVTCEAGAFEGGHSRSAPRAAAHACLIEINRRSRALRGR